ncbi:MAG: transcriptional repressor NrdR [Chthonomonas sp.]|nr:transcriptional repressor NrdR [Chthonomonas sp.]
MKCPYCGYQEQKVLDSRPSREEEAIRRRRECLQCSRRFTTFEQPEKPRLFVVKRSGEREEFSRDKVLMGMVTACRKRPVRHDDLRDAAERIERELFDLCEPEIDSTEIGERVESALLNMDGVAYVRFASVYREFADAGQFNAVVDALRRDQKRLQSTQKQ